MILKRNPNSYYLELESEKHETIYVSTRTNIEDFKQYWLSRMADLFDETVNSKLKENKNNESNT